MLEIEVIKALEKYMSRKSLSKFDLKSRGNKILIHINI